MKFTTTISRKLMVLLLLAHLTGCLTPEETVKVEESTPTSSSGTNGDTDFTVTPGGGTNSGQSTNDGSVINPDAGNGTVGTAEENISIVEDELNTFSIDINNGATHTDLTTLNISLVSPPNFNLMRLGKTRDCSDGTWIRKSNQASINITSLNAVQTVSVQFRDFDNVLSPCLVKTIIHDNSGPEIVIKKYPLATLEEGASTEIITEVTDVSGLETVTCTINGVTKPCLSGLSTIQLNSMSVGNYSFTIQATDKRGLSSNKTLTWSVASTVRQVTQTVRVGDERKFDILVVVDNSGSMGYEQRSMAQRVSNMLAILRGLDYQIAVTTTDPRNVAYSDGRLIQITNTNRYWIDSTMDEATAQLNLGLTIQRSEVGWGLEQGILTTHRMLERSIAGENAGFIRPNAKLAVIIISDEDESANTAKNDPENLLKLVSTNWPNKTFAFHSIINKPGDTACRSTHGAAYGHRLAQLSTLTGGIIGSVCEADYAAQVSGIATDIRNMLKNITLTCKPIEGSAITIKKDGVTLTESPVLDGVNLKFADALAIGEYEVKYTCLKE